MAACLKRRLMTCLSYFAVLYLFPHSLYMESYVRKHGSCSIEDHATSPSRFYSPPFLPTRLSFRLCTPQSARYELCNSGRSGSATLANTFDFDIDQQINTFPHRPRRRRSRRYERRHLVLPDRYPQSSVAGTTGVLGSGRVLGSLSRIGQCSRWICSGW